MTESNYRIRIVATMVETDECPEQGFDVEQMACAESFGEALIIAVLRAIRIGDAIDMPSKRVLDKRTRDFIDRIQGIGVGAVDAKRAAGSEVSK